MADATLTAERRTAAGKGPAGRLRREGLLPGVVYGLGAENVAVAVSSRDLANILSGESGVNTLITLRVDGRDELTMARQIQRDPVKGALVHVDFVRVHADRPIEADVPVHLVGTAEGVSLGGILEQMMHTVIVEARPAELPPSLELDVSALAIGGEVRVRDLTVPAGVTLKSSGDDLVAHVSAPRALEPTAAEAAEAEAAAAEAEAAGGAEAEAAGGEAE